MKDAPAFDFYPERWLVGTAMFSDAEQISYLRLLCHQWLMQGLPDSHAALKRLAGKGVTAAVLEKFPVCDDGMRRNRRLEIIRNEQRERIAKRREGAAKTNAKRWGSDTKCDSSASRSATRERVASDVVSESPPPTTHHPPRVLLEKEPKPLPAAVAAPVGVDADSSVAERQKAKAATKDEPAADPRHHAITSVIKARFKAITNREMTFDGRDVVRLKRFLAGWNGTLDDFWKTASAAWKRADEDRFASACKKAGTLCGLCENWAAIEVELQRPMQPQIPTGRPNNSAPQPARQHDTI